MGVPFVVAGDAGRVDLFCIDRRIAGDEGPWSCPVDLWWGEPDVVRADDVIADSIAESADGVAELVGCISLELPPAGSCRSNSHLVTPRSTVCEARWAAGRTQVRAESMGYSGSGGGA
jgi:hypothetical protein